MVRVRLGGTWKQDPALRSALARGGAAAEEAAAHVVDALALEVDGVDVVAGRAEGALLGGVEALGEAVLRLLAGSARAQVHFSEGGLELVLGRRAGCALLTVVSMSRPARVLARDVEVDLAELARAARDAVGGLADDLGSLPGLRATATTLRLRGLAERLQAARPAPAQAPLSPAHAPAPQAPRRRDAPTCTFELRDQQGLIASYRGPGADLGSLLAPGRVVLRAPDGREVVAVAGPPFLVLRDLTAFAGSLSEAMRRGEAVASVELAGPGRHATIALAADLLNATISRQGGPPLPCPPLPLARALLEAALDLCGVVAARNASQAENGWLAELRIAAAERLAHVQELLAGDLVAGSGGLPARHRRPPRIPGAPLGPGRMRRLVFRRAWEADAGTPAGFGVLVAGDLLVAAGAAAVLGLDARGGEVRWRRSGATLAVSSASALYLGDAARLASLEPTTGRERWSRHADALPERLRDVVRLAGGLALAVGPHAAAALDPATGRTAWSFAPPAAGDLRAAAFGPIAVLGSEAGFLYGVEAASGRIAWRHRLPGPLVSTPTAYDRGCLALCSTELGGSLVMVDPTIGRRRFEVPLDVTPGETPVPFAGLLAVSGVVAGDPVVAAVEPRGTLAWECAPPLGPGPVALAPLASGLLIKTAQGGCAALDRTGASRWNHAGHALHPPPLNAPPVLARGVALIPGEQVVAVDVATGRILGHPRLTAPVRLVADAHLNAWAMDAEGLVTAVRLQTHLGVL